MEHIRNTPKDRRLITKRLKAIPLQEGVIFTEQKAVVVWKDYTWDTGEITRFWTRGFDGVPEQVITIRKIDTSKSKGS